MEPSSGASGCAKVILFGEHAVVYGQPALAAALASGATAHRVERGTQGPTLEVPAWNVTAQPGDGTRLGDALEAIAGVIAQHSGALPNAHLCLAFDVPVGAGLGSSAAMAVAIARAMLPGASDDVVLQAAEASERIFHGDPSGVDHTTSTLGGMLRFRRSATPPFVPLDGVAPLPVIVAQMEPGADTGVMVSGVRARLDQEPEVGTQLLEWMGLLTHHAETALIQGDRLRLGRLMNLAHGALVSLGVSTPALDRGCHIARQAGAYGAKLTGAGGGGCLIALASDTSQEAVVKALEEDGAMCVLATWAGVKRFGPSMDTP
ncbi:MAG: mevalonate kinase [Myxococcota bacterium]